VPVFADTEQLYQVLDGLFRRISENAEIERALLAGKFVLRFRYSDPDGQVTADLRGDSLTWELGDSDLTPDLELIQSADVAHDFWLGELNVPLAIASRKVVSRGDISKALALLPAVKPAYALYREALTELGLDALIPAEREGTWPTGMVARLRAGARSLWTDTPLGQIERVFRRAPEVDPAVLNAHHIPIGTADEEPAAAFREVVLPADEPALKLEMLRRMLSIRAFEQKLSELYADGRVPTEAIHLSIGQEATAVGSCFALRSDDYLATTHRGHGHMLAKGAPLDRMMAEIMGKANGLCGGKGGSMHVTDATVGAIGANGIVGASPLIAAGAGHSIRQRGTDQVAVAYFGDGSTNQGMFHEALNFAAVFDLPVVFVLENNQYGEFTAVSQHCRVDKLETRAAAYNIPATTVDGNDVWRVYEAMGDAVARARRGAGPTLLVCDTYRWHGHMEGEAGTYRSAEEIASWKERCPILAWRQVLEQEGVADVATLDDLAAQASDEVDKALEAALTSPEPSAEALTEDVYAPEPSYLFREVAAGGEPEREISCSAAIREALAEELERDERVYLLGEDVTAGGYFAVTTGLVERFGVDRIVDTPISEYAIVGSAVGSAMTGCRPVAEILFSDFLTTCMDPIVNNAAKLRYMSGGQYRMPLVVRTPGGGGLGMAAQHSQSFEGLLANVPGLIIMAPGTAADAKGLLKAAIRSNNPVIFFENKLAYASTGPVPEGDRVVPIGVAKVVREGTDVTLVPIGGALNTAQLAAEQLARDGIEVEIVDPRTLVPLDLAAIVTSLCKTGRLVTLEEAPYTHGFGAEIVARVCDHAFSALRAAPRRVAASDVPIPYNMTLERMAIPDVARVEAAVRAVVG
jgi:2-oxoisovalerate dehydrogenase E1 component